MNKCVPHQNLSVKNVLSDKNKIKLNKSNYLRKKTNGDNFQIKYQI